MMKSFRNAWTAKAESGKQKAKKTRQAGQGFSLIEMIGVLAIMGILAGMLAPPLIRQLQQARTTNEDANLEEVARAILEGIKATGTIPNPNLAPYDAGGWADVAYRFTTLTDDTAPGGGVAPGTLHYVFPAEANFANTARRVYLDPDFLRYLDNVYGGLTAPFTTPTTGWPETAGGLNFPSGAIKLYIVSSSRPDFVLGCPANGPGIQVSANSYRTPLISQLASWIKVIDPATGFIRAPGTEVENWPNNGHQFLHIKTIDLRPLFSKINLRDLAAPPSATVSSAGTHSYPAIAGNPVNGSALGYTFNFVPNGGLGNPFVGGEIGILTTSLNQKILINRAGVLPPFNIKDNNTTPANQSQAQLSLPLAPQWEVNSLGVNPFPPAIPPKINSFTIYLIKGTSLKLYDSAVSPNVLFNIQVTADSNFEYFNGSWTRVD